MYGASGYGRSPYGSRGGAVPVDFNAMLSESRSELIYTAQVKVRNIATDVEETLFLGSSEWASRPDDVPASQPFDGRLTTALSFGRSIVGDRVGVDFTSSEGSISFLNSDGAYDGYLDGYAVDGRSVIVRVGRKSDLLSSHLTIFNGTAVDWSADDTSITITVKDRGYLLDKPSQPNVYTTPLQVEGQRKPSIRTAGTARSVAPTLINESYLIYQLSDQAGTVPLVVYDQGVRLTADSPINYADQAALALAAIPAGRYARCSAEGLVRLGSSPSGTILMDAYRSNGPATTGELVLDIVEDVGGLVDSDLDRGTFHSLELTAPAPICHFLGPGDSVTVRELINTLMDRIGGWVGFNRAGRLAAGILTAPSGDPVAAFDRDEGDIIDLSLERLPSGVWPPPWRWRVTASPRWAGAQTEIASGATASDRISLAIPYAITVAEDAAILADHILAQDPPPIEAFYTSGSDAEAEADRLMALYSGDLRLYRFTVGRRGLALELGSLIRVTWPRFGLDAGKLLRVVGLDDRIDLGDGSGVETVEVTAFG